MVLDAENERKIDELQKWFRECPQLPQDIDRILLRRFFKCVFGDVEEAKKVLIINYALRNKHAHLFLKRDPLDEDSRWTKDYADMVPLPGLTPEKYKISCYRLVDFDPGKMRHTEDTKYFFMVSDCRFVLPDVDGGDGDDGSLSEGEVQIFDMEGYTMHHVTKLTISTLRAYMKFLQEAYPVRLRAIHMINCPPYLDKVVAVVKPFISTAVFNMIRFHTRGMKSLYEEVPREMLPNEYGGEAGSLGDLKARINRIMEEKRDYLMDPRQWKIEDFEESKSKWSFF